jgi:hypothetical protein
MNGDTRPPGPEPAGPIETPSVGPAANPSHAGPDGTTQDPATGPQAFVRRLLKPPAPLGGYRELGHTPLALQLQLPEDQLGGHWCSRCQGIWWGTALEVQCPVCGNRNG